MFANIIWLIAFIAITAIGIRFILRLIRPFGGVKRTAGAAFLTLFTLLIGIFSVLAFLGMLTIYMPRGNPVQEVTVAGTPTEIARGETIASWACAGCHSPNKELPLSGGDNLFADVPMPLGVATPANLTAAGRIGDYTDGELQRIIREGTSADGHLLPIMSSNTFRYLSQPDLDALVAYLRSVPAVESEFEEKNSLSFLTMALTTLGMMPLKDPPDFDPPPHVDPAANVEYGEYVAKVFDCALCHGEDLTGGPGGILPAGPNLAGAKVWTTDQFITAMRTGETPYGTTIDPDQMPWEGLAKMNDDTLEAILLYVKQVSPS